MAEGLAGTEISNDSCYEGYGEEDVEVAEEALM
jgi:hypothetical protein